MKRMRLFNIARMMVLLASLAMAMTGFGHRFAQASPSPELLSYLSMGGTLDEICGDTGPAHQLTGTCEACVINSNALLSRVAMSPTRALTTAGLVSFACSPGPSRSAAQKDTHRARAPPVCVIA